MNAQTPIAEVDKPARVQLPALVAGGAVRAIVPQNLDEAWRMSGALHEAGMLPYGIDTRAKVMVAVLHGLEIGLTPMNALQSIAVINGKPTVYGDAALGLVRASGLLASIKETIEGEGDKMKARCVVRRKDEGEPVEGEFSVEDAKVAGLWTKTGKNGQPSPWQTYPKRMLKFRARAFALRDAFADVLKGIHIREEVEDYTHNVERQDEEPPAPPPPPEQRVASPSVAPADVVDGEVVEESPPTPAAEQAAKPAEAEELTMAALYDEKPAQTVVQDDEDGPPDPAETAPAAKTVAATDDDLPAFLDRRETARTPEMDRMKGSLLRDIDTLESFDDFDVWMRDVVDPIAGLPAADQLQIRNAFYGRLKSKLLASIALLKDADGFQTWAADARDAINLLPSTDQAEVRTAFSKRQEDAFKAVR